MPDTTEWIKQIRDGTASPQLKEMASRGLVPFPPAELVLVLTLLAADPAQAIGEQARRTMAGLPRRVIWQTLDDSGADPAALTGLAEGFADDGEVLARLVSHQALPEDLFATLCESRHVEVLEALARNQERLRKNYAALMRLIANPALPTRLVGYLKEERERQRAAQKAPDEEVTFTREIEQPEVKFDEVLVKDFEEEDKVIPPHKRQQVVEHRHKSIFQIIRTLNTGEKLILALKGNKEARYLLVRDSNKQVATKVLESPRLGDSEVEMIAKMTNVCDEVLRAIAHEKMWMGKYNICKALALNPKTPVGISLTLVNKFSVRDLSLMARNRNIPEVIRQTAARLYRQRREQRSGAGAKH